MAQVHLSEGTILDERYRLDGVLGAGGYGITYRATDTRLDRPVAVKEYFPCYCALRLDDWGADVRCTNGCEGDFLKGMDRFYEEARHLAQLSGLIHVVNVNDYFKENSTAYMVMDFVEGKTLKEMTDSFGGRMKPKTLMTMMAPAISALWQVHKKGLIHRDLSPDNIMVRFDGSVCLIDFGNARDTTSDKSMTMAMKQGFAGPEQYSSRGQGPYTDVYGMCATMYYCLTGAVPTQALERLTGKPLARPSELGVTMDPNQEQAIMDGLELRIERRIQNMDALWKRLYGQSDSPAEVGRQMKASLIDRIRSALKGL